MNCTKIKDKEECETVLNTKGLRSCRYNQKSRECEDLPEKYRVRATQKSGLMSGIAKKQKEDEDKEDEEDKHVTNKPKRELFSTYPAYVEEKYLHNMASLISASRHLKENDFIFVNGYFIFKKYDRINIRYKTSVDDKKDIKDLSIAELIFFVKKILCGERVMLKWLYRSGNTYHTTYPIDKNILSMVENDYSAGFIRRFTILKDLRRILSEETQNVSTINYILDSLLLYNDNISSIDQEKIIHYFCNNARKTTQYLSDFVEWSKKYGIIKSTDNIDIDLEEEKSVPKLVVKTKQNILGDKLFEKRDIRYYVDYLMKRYDDLNYGPIAAAMIVEGAVVKDIPLSYLERSLFEIKRKIQSIHDELLRIYTGTLPLFVYIFYEYQTRNFRETCSAYSEITYNFIADNYLFGGCNCECGVYLLAYIQSLYPDNNWDYYSVSVKNHIYSIVVNKKTRQIYKLETTDMTTRGDFIRELETQKVDEFRTLAYSDYSLALGIFSVSTISSRIKEDKKFEDMLTISVCFLYKRYLSKDIIDSITDVSDIENYISRRMIMKLSNSIITRDKGKFKNVLDVLWIYEAIIQISIKYYYYEKKKPENKQFGLELTKKINDHYNCIDIIFPETVKYFKQHYLD